MSAFDRISDSWFKVFWLHFLAENYFDSSKLRGHGILHVIEKLNLSDLSQLVQKAYTIQVLSHNFFWPTLSRQIILEEFNAEYEP